MALADLQNTIRQNAQNVWSSVYSPKTVESGVGRLQSNNNFMRGLGNNFNSYSAGPGVPGQNYETGYNPNYDKGVGWVQADMQKRSKTESVTSVVPTTPDIPNTTQNNVPTTPQVPNLQGGAGTWEGDLVPDQLGDPQLSRADALAACGPAAAVAFARYTGRTPTVSEATNLARQVGWTAQAGMGGVANEQKLLTNMGIESTLDLSGDKNGVINTAWAGKPVIISTPQHYFVADSYDPQSGKLHVGASGTVMSNYGGGAWMTFEQIKAVGTGINGVLYLS